jgi:hypothetical protein
MSEGPTLPKTDPTLLALLDRSMRAIAAMSPEQLAEMRRKQSLSWARAEAGFGSDTDELAYRQAHRSGDVARMAELDAEAEARVAVFNKAVRP